MKSTYKQVHHSALDHLLTLWVLMEGRQRTILILCRIQESFWYGASQTSLEMYGIWNRSSSHRRMAYIHLVICFHHLWRHIQSVNICLQFFTSMRRWYVVSIWEMKLKTFSFNPIVVKHWCTLNCFNWFMHWWIGTNYS